MKMSKKLLFAFIIIALLIAFVSFSFTSSIEQTKKVKKINDNVIEEINKNGKANVIIKLKNNNLLKKQSSSGHEEIKSLSVGQKDLKKLESDPNIENVRLQMKITSFLINSTVIVNATRTWPLQINSINLTGTGETVCILDTSTNFTHSNLIGKNKTCIIDCFNKTCVENCSAFDDNGHGTHVAGIVAANGSLNGVAPGVSLISVKVLDENGAGSDNSEIDLSNAIDWCVNNRLNYNISVISMSLGTVPMGETYCDSDFVGTWTDSINNAVANNISVIAASGNSGSVPRNTTSIAAPACIENVTAVSATDKDDAVASYAHFNSLVDLFAPGTNINSTYNNGGYEILSGTSMSTPHVSAAFALVRQFYLLETGKVYTPLQIQNALKNTGKNITTSTNLNISRINTYAAIISLDNQAPNITLISPSNGNFSLNLNQTFTCNASDLALKNVTFYLWNSTGIYNQTFNSISGNSYNFETNLTSLPMGNYKWNCQFTDENNNAVFASSNYSFYTADPYVTLNSPVNDSVSTQNQTFNCSATSSVALKNVTFYLWNSTSLQNSSFLNVTGLTNSTTFNYSFTQEDNYKWNCLFANNNSNQYFASSNYTIIYDITSPNITLISPYPTDETSSSTSKTFYYNISDSVGIKNCSLITNAAINLTNLSITNLSLTQNFTQTFTPGTYSWSINCTDFGNNVANSSTQSFIITAPASPPSSSGGGGSGGGGGQSGSTYAPSTSEISAGYTKQLKKDDKIKFSLNKENHTITVNSIANNSINLTVQSTPTKLNLLMGQSKKLNLTSDDYYDLLIKLESITGGNANLTIKTINESINRNVLIKAFNNTEKINDTNVNNVPAGKKANNNYQGYLFYVGILVIVIVIIYILSLVSRQKKSEKGKELVRMVKLN